MKHKWIVHTVIIIAVTIFNVFITIFISMYIKNTPKDYILLEQDELVNMFSNEIIATNIRTQDYEYLKLHLKIDATKAFEIFKATDMAWLEKGYDMKKPYYIYYDEIVDSYVILGQGRGRFRFEVSCKNGGILDATYYIADKSERN